MEKAHPGRRSKASRTGPATLINKARAARIGKTDSIRPVINMGNTRRPAVTAGTAGAGRRSQWGWQA